MEWSLLYPDPCMYFFEPHKHFLIDLLSELTKALGVHGIWVEEISDLSDHALSDHKFDFVFLTVSRRVKFTRPFRKIHGAMLLYTWSQKLPTSLKEFAYVPQLFFANQSGLGSALTQALISVILNQSEVDIGPMLQKYKEISATLDSKV